MGLDLMKSKCVCNYDESALDSVFTLVYMYQQNWALKTLEMGQSISDQSEKALPHLHQVAGKAEKRCPKEKARHSSLLGKWSTKPVFQKSPPDMKTEFHWLVKTLFLQLLCLHSCYLRERNCVHHLKDYIQEIRYSWWIRENFSKWSSTGVMSWNNAQEPRKECHLTDAK